MKVIIESGPAILHRLSRTQTYLAVAQVIGMRGTCRRAQVGCVITQENRIVSTGYNGSLRDHCINCDLTKGCEEAVHAEANAIAFAAREGIRLEGANLYCTYAPCHRCAKLIIQAGIKRVFYEIAYREENGLLLMQTEGVEVNQYSE